METADPRLLCLGEALKMIQGQSLQPLQPFHVSENMKKATDPFY